MSGVPHAASVGAAVLLYWTSHCCRPWRLWILQCDATWQWGQPGVVAVQCAPTDMSWMHLHHKYSYYVGASVEWKLLSIFLNIFLQITYIDFNKSICPLGFFSTSSLASSLLSMSTMSLPVLFVWWAQYLTLPDMQIHIFLPTPAQPELSV